MAATRCIPGVCGVFASNSCGLTMRTVGFSAGFSDICCPFPLCTSSRLICGLLPVHFYENFIILLTRKTTQFMRCLVGGNEGGHMNIILTLLPLLVPFVMLAHVFVQLMSRHPDKYTRLYSTCLSTGPF